MILQAKNIDMLNKNNLDFKVNFFKNTMLAHLSAELLTHGMSQEEQDVFYTSYLEMQDKNNHISIPHEKIKELATKEPYEKILYIQSELLTQDIPNHKKNVIKNLVTQFYNKNKSFIDNKFMYELRNMTADKKINAIAKDLTISHQSIQAQSKSDSSKETNRLIS